MPNPRFGVLLVNLGTPEAPTAPAVRRYLAEFLSDRRVVDAPRPIWLPILYGVVLPFRPVKVAKAYRSIWTDEGSPLLVISRRQQHALAKRLSEHFGAEIPVELAMTYGKPSMKEAGLALRDRGVKKILMLPLYPQFSRATTASVFDSLARNLSLCPAHPELRTIRSYHDHPGYIAALAASVREHWKRQGFRGHLVMSYHGVPKRYAEQGDPYAGECARTSQLLGEALGLKDDEWSMTFQSRFGREEWLKPYTDKTLEAWGKEKRFKAIDIMSPAFAADCLETLEELAVENKENYLEAGGERYTYIPALNEREDHVQMFADLVVQHTQGW